jgi:hypothetical protein
MNSASREESSKTRSEGLKGSSSGMQNNRTAMEGNESFTARLPICPDCRQRMIPEGGCSYCPFCGYSACG